MADDKKDHLVPVRHAQGDLFMCEIGDAVLKSDIASMEHPIFGLSKNPCMTERKYTNGDVVLEVTPSSKGIANIYDKDVLIYAISKVMQAKNAGLPYSRHVVFQAQDFLQFTNRHTGGTDYEKLKAALHRLDGTRLRTTIKTGGEETWEAFGLIEGAKIKQCRPDGRITEWGITLSEWLFKAVEAAEVLTLHPDYFRLRKPIERRIYEVARKHCGKQSAWEIGIENLIRKCGSSAPIRNFKVTLRKMCQSDHLPDYSMEIIGDKVRFTNRQTMIEDTANKFSTPLNQNTYEEARQVAPGWDVYHIEAEWRLWVSDAVEQGMDPPRSPDAAFIGFCKKWNETRERL